MANEFGEIEVPEILPPSDDGVFKTLLTHPDAKSCLRDIIASNIGLPVKEVTVRNTELPIGDVLEKRERFDVSCEIDGGDQAEVEMQADPVEGDSSSNKHKNLRSRAIYNACDLHSKQKGIGVPYGKLVRTYQITFCGYAVFEGRDDCFTRFSFRSAEGEELLDAVNNKGEGGNKDGVRPSDDYQPGRGRTGPFPRQAQIPNGRGARQTYFI